MPTIRQRFIRRLAWRCPAIARNLWIWPWAGCRIQLIVDLDQVAASRLDAAAILRVYHDRDRLELSYSLQCGCFYRADCQHSAALDGVRQSRVTPLITQSISRKWRTVATRGQEHLYDAHGYAPGVYEIDEQSERAILAALDAGRNFQPVNPEPPRTHSGDNRSARRNHSSAQQSVLHPAHAAAPSRQA